MVTLYKTIEDIKTIAGTEPNIGYIADGDIYELNSRQDINYPAFVVTQGTHRSDIDNETEIYTLTLFCVDRLISDQTNKLDVLSWANTTLKTIIDKIEAANIGMVIGDYTVDVFTERFESVCAGAYATIQIEVDVENCAAGGLRFVTSVNGMAGDVIINTGTGGSTDLSNYYNKKQVDDKITDISVRLSEIKDCSCDMDLSDYITKDDVSIYAKIIDVSNNYYNKQYINKAVEDLYKAINDSSVIIPDTSGGDIDLSQYYTKIQADGIFAKKSEIPNLDNYYTKAEVDDEIKDELKKYKPDPSIYVTHDELTQNYYNKTYINDTVQNIYKKINDTSCLCEDYGDLINILDSSVNDLYGKIKDISVCDCSTKLSKIDTSINILDSSVNDLYGKLTDVSNNIKDCSCDLSNYYTKDVIDTSINDLYGKLTDIDICDCSTKINDLTNTINDISTDLSNNYVKMDNIIRYGWSYDAGTKTLTVRNVTQILYDVN